MNAGSSAERDADLGIGVPGGQGAPVVQGALGVQGVQGVPGLPQARQAVQLAHWAARAFAGYEIAVVRRIVAAVAAAAGAHAQQYARREVAETGWGNVADRTAANLLCSQAVLAAHIERDYVSPRLDPAGALELPRPVGTLLYLAGATSPVAGICHAVIVALLTRNAVVVSPDPLAAECSADAVRMLAQVAVAAGAPAGVIQVIDSSSAVRRALVEEGQAALVFAADGDHGNVPVLVDSTADIQQAAEKLIQSVAFDYSLAGGAESVLIVEDVVARPVLAGLGACGGVVLTGEECHSLRVVLCSLGSGDDETSAPASLIGRSAVQVAARAGILVPPSTRVLLAPFDLADRTIHDEPLARQKRFPVLGVVRVGDAGRGIRLAATVASLGSARHSAVIHSQSRHSVMDFAAAIDVPQVVVNDGGSFGGAAVNSGLEPGRLIGFTKVTATAILPDSLPDSLPDLLAGSSAESAPMLVPPYPTASNLVNR